MLFVGDSHCSVCSDSADTLCVRACVCVCVSYTTLLRLVLGINSIVGIEAS